MTMTMGQVIAAERRKCGLTQEALAQQLGVTNQAVSKWESNQCYPDITLLPRLAEVFSVSIDALFGRAPDSPSAPDAAEVGQTLFVQDALPWEDDDTMRVVVFVGRRLLTHMDAAREMTFTYHGEAFNVHSELNLICGEVDGDATAGESITCADVGGDVTAGADVQAGEVGGNVQAGKSVYCGSVGGDVTAEASVTCTDVGGDVTAGADVQAGEVGGDVKAGKSVYCGSVGGDVTAETSVTCADVGGDVHCALHVNREEQE